MCLSAWWVTSSALTDFHGNQVHLHPAQHWKKPQKISDTRSINWKMFWQNVYGHRSNIQCQEHEEQTHTCINIQKPFWGSAILCFHQELLIWCQLLTARFLVGFKQVLMKNSNPWSHKSLFLPIKSLLLSFLSCNITCNLPLVRLQRRPTTLPGWSPSPSIRVGGKVSNA